MLVFWVKTMNSAITIFVPKQLERKTAGLLHGRFTTTFETVTDKQKYVVVLSSGESQANLILGFIRNNPERLLHSSIGNSPDSPLQSYVRNIWLEVQTEPSFSIHSAIIDGHSVCLDNVTLVYYDSDEIWESELVSRKYTYVQSEQQKDILPYFVDCVLKEGEQRCATKDKKNVSGIVFVIEILIHILTLIPKITMRNIHVLFKEKMDYSSNAMQQIILRIGQLKKLTLLMQKKRRNIVSGRLMTMIFVDILFGIAVAYIISHHASVNDIYDSFCNCTKVLSSSVHDLLEWLSGAPAGLKLNQPLTQALSAFFSYHVHLWRLYLDLADPLLKGLAWILVWLGMFGLSIQVAILSDLLDLATLHLYCFYVYAARIHMLQISLLGSQWRAFRGRKWNPLKVRIDSDSGSHMSLKRVLTAVVFTLVIFLLPTTTVYYLVFVTLRVSLSALRGILTFCIWLLNSNPLYLVLLNVVGSNRIKGDICFKACNIGTNHSSMLIFHLHTWSTPVIEALEYAKSEVFPVQPSLNWKTILSSVVFGKNLL